jgi:hypothetical protein
MSKIKLKGSCLPCLALLKSCTGLVMTTWRAGISLSGCASTIAGGAGERFAFCRGVNWAIAKCVGMKCYALSPFFVIHREYIIEALRL